MQTSTILLLATLNVFIVAGCLFLLVSEIKTRIQGA